jgi:hypothetical protein
MTIGLKAGAVETALPQQSRSSAKIIEALGDRAAVFVIKLKGVGEQ